MKNLFKSVKSIIQYVPQQIRYLLLIFIVFMTGFVIFRKLFIPDSFGLYGHYRAAAVDSVMAQPIAYAGQHVCIDCHDDIAEEKYTSSHKNVSCESCHGAGLGHTEAPGEKTLNVPTGRDYCGFCHSYNPSRPTGFPQIDPVTHNPTEVCMNCHSPHKPEPPDDIENCSACHGAIENTKAASHHQMLACTRCHTVETQHNIEPQKYLPIIPDSREFCGQCHAEDAGTEQEIVRVDLDTHGEKYLCSQCHYPHFPEAY